MYDNRGNLILSESSLNMTAFNFTLDQTYFAISCLEKMGKELLLPELLPSNDFCTSVTQACLFHQWSTKRSIFDFQYSKSNLSFVKVITIKATVYFTKLCFLLIIPFWKGPTSLQQTSHIKRFPFFLFQIYISTVQYYEG